MLISWIKNNLVKGRRQTSRFSANPAVRCFVASDKFETSKQVQLLDISDTGFSFSTPYSHFEIGDQFSLIFNSNECQAFEKNVKIVAQHVYYPYGLHSTQRAMYRFSGTFEKNLSETEIKNISLSQPSSTQEAA